MRWAIRLIVTTAVAVATVIVAFDASSLRESSKYQPPKGLVVTSIVLLGVGVLYGYFDAALERRRSRRRVEAGALISNIAFPFWAKLTEQFPNLAIQRSFGFHVWMVPSWHWDVIPDKIRKLSPEKLRQKLPTPEMWRAAKYRLDATDSPTDISWRRDVGVIGKCWRTRQKTYIDLVALWGTNELDEAAFAALSEDDRLGLSYNQYLVLRNKYSAVLAIPVFKDADNTKNSQFIGAVVVDCLLDNSANLDVKAIRTPAWLAARQVSKELRSIHK